MNIYIYTCISNLNMFKCNIMCNLHGRYISIGMYMPMVGLVGGGFLLTALGLWFKLLLPDDEQIKVSGLVVDSFQHEIARPFGKHGCQDFSKLTP